LNSINNNLNYEQIWLATIYSKAIIKATRAQPAPNRTLKVKYFIPIELDQWD
jgi:hypothetical protein